MTGLGYIEHLFRGYRVSRPQEIAVKVLVCQKCGASYASGPQTLGDQTVPLSIVAELGHKGCTCGCKEFNVVDRVIVDSVVSKTNSRPSLQEEYGTLAS